MGLKQTELGKDRREHRCGKKSVRTQEQRKSDRAKENCWIEYCKRKREKERKRKRIRKKGGKSKREKKREKREKEKSRE